MLLVTIVYLVINIIHVYSSDVYSKWCNAEELFKPYITIYQHRGGDELASGGPKFYPTDHYSNLYICLNGPAWLYFARHSAIGDVYHEPKFKVYEHECQAFNGLPGPGSHADPVILMGVYLLGEDEDYRLPSIHLFTAPLYNSVTGIYENTTSVMTINNKECKISKGKKKETTILVHPQPKEKYSYCKMPYQNIDLIYTTPSPLPADIPDPSKLKNLLKNDDVISKGECKKEEGTPLSADSVLKWRTDVKTSWADYFKRLEDECKKLNEQIKVVTDSAVDPGVGPVTKADEIDPDAATGLPKQIEEKKKDLTDPAKKADAEKELKVLEARYEKAKFQHDAFLKYESDTYLKYGTVKEICPADSDTTKRNESYTLLDLEFTDTTKDFDKMFKEVETAETALKTAIDNLKTDPTATAGVDTANTTLHEKIDNYIKAVEAMKEKELKERKKWQNYLENVIIATSAVTAWKVAEKAGEKPPKYVAPANKAFSGFLPILQDYQFNTTDKGISCTPLPKVEDSCKAAKPDLKRACHFLKAMSEDPDICQRDEKLNMDDPAVVAALPPLEPVKNLIGADFVEIMDLIEDIFAHSCQRLDSNFPKRINRIFKCYLLKPMIHGGAGFDIRTPTPGREIDFRGAWPQIKTALVDCKNEKKRLLFRRDPTDKQKYQLWMRNGTGKYAKDIHLHQEQADRQFPFNFAIDMHFKMFATVMGICMASETYVKRNSFLTPSFFAKYTDLFFTSLEAEWTDSRDNAIFNMILGNYKKRGGKFWANHCMEASFITSEDTNYRPPRKLYVNSHTEGNYFISGKLANTQGMYNF